jgi:hypothetical protein
MLFGAALIAVGVYGFVASGSTHPTALIPAAIGAVLAILGGIALLGGAARKHAMHVAAAVGLLGFAGTVNGVVPFVKFITTNEQDEVRQNVPQANTPQEVREQAARNNANTTFLASVSKTATAALCLVFVGFCVKSFIDARVARQAASPPPASPPPSGPAQPTPA